MHVAWSCDRLTHHIVVTLLPLGHGFRGHLGGLVELVEEGVSGLKGFRLDGNWDLLFFPTAAHLVTTLPTQSLG